MNKESWCWWWAVLTVWCHPATPVARARHWHDASPVLAPPASSHPGPSSISSYGAGDPQLSSSWQQRPAPPPPPPPPQHHLHQLQCCSQWVLRINLHWCCMVFPFFAGDTMVSRVAGDWAMSQSTNRCWRRQCCWAGAGISTSRHHTVPSRRLGWPMVRGRMKAACLLRVKRVNMSG